MQPQKAKLYSVQRRTSYLMRHCWMRWYMLFPQLHPLIHHSHHTTTPSKLLLYRSSTACDSFIPQLKPSTTVKNPHYWCHKSDSLEWIIACLVKFLRLRRPQQQHHEASNISRHYRSPSCLHVLVRMDLLLPMHHNHNYNYNIWISNCVQICRVDTTAHFALWYILFIISSFSSLSD